NWIDRTGLLVINDLFFHLGREFPKFILLISELWFKACFPDSFLYALTGKAVRRSRSADYIFFKHNASKIVGPRMETNLRGLFAYSEPGCLNILDIGQHNPAHRNHADIFFLCR